MRLMTQQLHSLFVCSALETVWSYRHQAPSTGTTNAVEHRTATYACTVGFFLLLEGTTILLTQQIVLIDL